MTDSDWKHQYQQKRPTKLLSQSMVVELTENVPSPDPHPAKVARIAVFCPDGNLWFLHSDTHICMIHKDQKVNSLEFKDVDTLDKITVTPDGTFICVASSESDIA